mgnify:CR=1 FL=1
MCDHWSSIQSYEKFTYIFGVRVKKHLDEPKLMF